MSSSDNLPALLTTLGSVALLLAAIAGGIVVARMPRTVRLPRALAATGLFLILGHAVWTILETLVIYSLGFPPLVTNILGWLSFLTVTVGFALLVVAATMATTPARSATPSPYPHPPHTQPQSPPPMPGPSSPHPGA